MSIFFTQGTLNPSSTSLARDIRQAWVSAFSGQPNWTVMDDGYTNGTVERSVIMNSNGFGLMICNSTTLTNTSVYVFLLKTYNASTHIGVVGFASVRNLTPDANGFNTQTFNPATITSVFTDAVGQISSTGDNFITATPSQTAWTGHINSEQATLSVNTGGTSGGQWIHIGRATSLIQNPSLTDNYPFFLTTSVSVVSTGTNSYAHFLTYPGFQSGIIRAGKPATTISIPPANASTTYADKYSITPTVGTLSPIYILRSDLSSGADNYLNGSLRCKLIDIMCAPPTNAIYGDRAIVGAKTYMYIGGLNSGIYTYANTQTSSLAGWAAIN